MTLLFVFEKGGGGFANDPLRDIMATWRLTIANYLREEALISV
jgi:hypothetical protein